MLYTRSTSGLGLNHLWRSSESFGMKDEGWLDKSDTHAHGISEKCISKE
jgi:hypothetical protein